MQDQLNEFTSDTSCPKCGSKNIAKVKYTWWGGLIGPKLLHHTKCSDCNHTFNSKTGKSNTSGIIIYSVILFAIAFGIFYMLRFR